MLLLLRLRTWLCSTIILLMMTSMRASYSNITLTSLDGGLSVVVYLPHGIKPNERTYYYASRFDHGSMIGSITRKTKEVAKNGKAKEQTHVLYGDGMWRVPHNSNWPESGVGLASEFGVGDDGAFCNYRCGWYGANDVTNGVLGYREVKNGETFLKIGVGELIKGSCPTCDSTEDYRFNSPYQFAREPQWSLTHINANAILLEHKAFLRTHGYKLVKEISLYGDVLSVTSTLTNLGAQAFSTVWYSHNFFTCDDVAVGPGYSTDLNLKGGRNELYQEPGTWSWSTPLGGYAKVKGSPESINVEMTKALDPGVRIKSEFLNDGATNGGFTLHACGTTIYSRIPQAENPQSGVSMYAYNLYVERGTFSPEPQVLLHFDPGVSRTWTQRLVIGGDPKTGDAAISTQTPPAPKNILTRLRNMTPASIVDSSRHPPLLQKLFALVVMAGFCTLGIHLVQLYSNWRSRRHLYTRIPEIES